MKFRVFGKELIVERIQNGWAVFHGGEGKRRRAPEIVIPPTVTEAQLATYLADLLHECARSGQDTVERIG
jgi:hypothetical protein